MILVISEGEQRRVGGGWRRVGHLPLRGSPDLGERYDEARSEQRVQIEHSNGHGCTAAPSTAAPSTAAPRTAATSTGRTPAVECLEEMTLPIPLTNG